MRIAADQIVRMMRASKTTIRATSARMNVSMDHVRRIRTYGLTEGYCRDNVAAYALDWFEGITGTTQGFDSWFVNTRGV